jgi:hypothetical protein
VHQLLCCCKCVRVGIRVTAQQRTSAGPAQRALAFSSSARAASYRDHSVAQVAGSQATSASLATACGGAATCWPWAATEPVDTHADRSALHGPTASISRASPQQQPRLRLAIKKGNATEPRIPGLDCRRDLLNVSSRVRQLASRLHELGCKQLVGLAERTVGHTRGCSCQRRPSHVVVVWPFRAVHVDFPAQSIVDTTCGPCRMVRWPRPSRSCGAAAASSRTHSASRRTPAASGTYRPTPANDPQRPSMGTTLIVRMQHTSTARCFCSAGIASAPQLRIGWQQLWSADLLPPDHRTFDGALQPGVQLVGLQQRHVRLIQHIQLQIQRRRLPAGGVSTLDP